MKRYRGPDGKERLWFEPSEIEYIIENELNKACVYPTYREPIVDIERLLESYLDVKLDQYATLENTVLGITSFRVGQNPVVEINKDLTDAVFDQEDSSVSLLGRWRATLAHEAAHVILHRPLFEVSVIQGNLFDGIMEQSQTELVIKCYKKNVGFAKGQSDWREFQANRGMATILMPQSLLAEVIKKILRSPANALPVEGSHEALLLVESISKVFQVSRQAATIRLLDSGTLIPAGQSQMRVR